MYHNCACADVCVVVQMWNLCISVVYDGHFRTFSKLSLIKGTAHRKRLQPLDGIALRLRLKAFRFLEEQIQVSVLDSYY